MVWNTKIITIPYFYAKANTCSIQPQRIELANTDPKGLLKKLENGENLFDVLGSFGEGLKKDFPLRFAHFEQVEAIKKNGKTIHSFLLILVTAKTKEEIKFYNLEKNKSKIISSDYQLLKKDLNKEIEIKNIFTKG